MSIKSFLKKNRFLIGMILLAVIVSIAPAVFAYIITPDGMMYTGMRGVTSGDYNVYLAHIEQIRQGSFIMQNLFTSEDQIARIINPLWILVGSVARILPLSSAVIFQLLKILLVVVFCYVLYWFVGVFLKDKKEKKQAFILALFGGGFGALSIPFLESGGYYDNGYFHWPMDLWVPESMGFLTISYNPHLIASTICMLLFVKLIKDIFEKKQKIKSSILLGTVGLIWFMFHPFHVITMTLLVVLYWFVVFLQEKKQALKIIPYMVLAGIIAAPSVLYYLWLMSIDPLSSIRAEQNNCFTTVWWITIISLGVFFFFGIYGAYKIIKNKNTHLLFVVVWMTAIFIAIYLPVNYQRRMIQGIHVPLAILSVVGWRYAWKHIQKKWKKYLLNVDTNFLKLLLVIIFVFLTPLYLFSSEIYLFTNPPQRTVYRSEGWKEMMDWIKENTEQYSVIASAPANGNFIPGWTGRKVFFGHSVETNNNREKVFLLGEVFEKKRDILDIAEEYNIDYLLFSENEKEFFGEIPEELLKYLEVVYQNDYGVLYRIILSQEIL